MKPLDFSEEIKTEVNLIVKRIYESIQNANLSYGELAQITGIAKSALHRYATGQTQKIPIDAVKLIANATGVSTAYLMGWEEEQQPIDKNLPPPNITEDYTTFPVIGEVAAGYDCPALEDWEGDLVDVPNKYLSGRPKEDFFVLRVKGDSMYPDYQDGDKVLVLKQSTLNYSGQVGVVLYDGDMGTLKRVEYKMGEDWMKLVPINPSYPPVKIVNQDLELCRVLGIPKMLIREIEE